MILFLNFDFSFLQAWEFLHTPWEREYPRYGLINTVNSFPFTQICASLKCVCQYFVLFYFSLFSCLPVIRTMSIVVILNVSFLFIKHICLIDLFFSLSFYGAAPGAMANHLISNALLRPHGTNNPYNTLLGEPAVCNNPSISMYNAQGVLEFLLSFPSESPTLCSFDEHIRFSFLLPFLGFGSRHTDSFSILHLLVLLFSIFLRLP